MIKDLTGTTQNEFRLESINIKLVKRIDELEDRIERLQEERDKIRRAYKVMLSAMEDDVKRLNKKLKNNTIRTITLER